MGKKLWARPEDLIHESIKISETGCWIWQKLLDHKGYGTIQTYYWAKYFKVRMAHQLSYRVFNGEYDRNLFVCHTCDIRSCVNPEHLFTGTCGDNLRDMHRKGRNNNLKGSAHPNSKLNEKDVREILDLVKVFTLKEVAAFYNVGFKHISAIKLRKSWVHLIT